ncbi:MAG: glycosyltransferase family 1 protein [Acidimicrobiia bacterium]|nr:glycosyltransferase family 1 protein [Acidimicrobiia bacterium]
MRSSRALRIRFQGKLPIAMARIVLTSWGSYGDINPYVGLALALKARGHEPVLACPAYYQGLAASEGIAFHTVRPNIDPGNSEIVSRVMHPRRGPEVILRELMLPSVEDAYEDLSEAAVGADLLVSHPISFAAPLLASTTGIPWVSCVLAPVSFFSKHDFPVLPFAPFLKRLEHLGPWAGPLLSRLARHSTRSWSDPVYRFRAKLGLPRGGDPIYEGQHSTDLVLVLFPGVLAKPQPDWPANVQVCGRIPFDGAHGKSLSAELEQFLAKGPAPVVFTLGSSAVMVAGEFYTQSLAAVEELGIRAVMLVGAEGMKRLAGRGSTNVSIVDAAPHSQLFPRAAVIVQQCGIGTLGQALSAGRPILAVPFANDQPDNAHRAEQLGVARVVYPRHYRAQRIVRELGQLLNEAKYEENGKKVGAQVREEDGVLAACMAIDGQLRRTAVSRCRSQSGIGL